jgi:peptidoglycan/xylan/chitin deacetylase (PgdA/CDA1 family)
MSIYPLRVPEFFQSFFPDLIWRMDNSDKKIHLTFDDGPTPGVTDKVLELLSKYNAKVTFFCIGKNVEENPFLFQSIIDGGHKVGNHTYNHNNGWKVSNNEYFDSIDRCNNVVKSNLFRPPYGKIKSSQTTFLKNHYKIIMWNVLSGDFDKTLDKEKCLNNVLKLTKSGSIVVFHDSIKASERMLYTLPKMLEYFSNKGYKFESISFL